MMLPALILVRTGRGRRLWIPLPTILLWPIWVLAWVVWAFSLALRLTWEKPLRMVLLLCLHLSGIRIDIQSNDGPHFHVRTF